MNNHLIEPDSILAGCLTGTCDHDESEPARGERPGAGQEGLHMINLKSELEIRMLHEKFDHLIIHQQYELLEIQKVQIEMMNDILNSMSERN